MHVPESHNDRAPAALDWAGAVLASVGLGCLVYGLIESSNKGWGDWTVMSTLVLAVVSLAAFAVIEMRLPSPMLPLTLFHARTFSGANLLTLLLYAALGGSLFFLPLNLIQVQGYSATAAGAALLPLILVMFVLSRWTGDKEMYAMAMRRSVGEAESTLASRAAAKSATTPEPRDAITAYVSRVVGHTTLCCAHRLMV